MTHIPAALRRLVTERAENCCEYCRISSEDRLVGYEIDHVIAEKHGGATTADNLCLSCYLCNGYKGSDISSVDWDGTGAVTSLYNPRTQHWSDHFELNSAVINPLSPEGRVTVFLLRLNSPERLAEREILIQASRYPCTTQ